jgi:hypothetical protein
VRGPPSLGRAGERLLQCRRLHEEVLIQANLKAWVN